MIEQRAIMITVPIPPRTLQPNARTHWRGLSAAKKNYKRAVMVCALEAMGGGFKTWPAAVGTAVFFFKDRRHRDRDNAAASLKYAHDEIVRAGLLTDDEHLLMMPVTIECDRVNPRVELTYTRVDDPSRLNAIAESVRKSIGGAP